MSKWNPTKTTPRGLQRVIRVLATHGEVEELTLCELACISQQTFKAYYRTACLRAGTLHVVRRERNRNGSFAAVYALGTAPEGMAPPSPRESKEQRSLARIVQALEKHGEMDVETLSRHAAISVSTFLRWCRADGLAKGMFHVSSLRRQARGGNPQPLYSAGPRPEGQRAPRRPRPYTSKERIAHTHKPPKRADPVLWALVGHQERRLAA